MPRDLLDTVFSPVKAFGHRNVREYVDGNPMVFPVTYELGPSGPGNCNNHCGFCMHHSYYGAKAIMPLELYRGFVDQIKTLSNGRPIGMIYSASGEPATNPAIIDFLEYTHEQGIDQALITNGTVLKKPGLVEAMVRYLIWTRTSLDAGTPETRAQIHGVRLNDFDQVLNSLTELATKKKEIGSRINIGAQIVVTPENIEEIVEATRRVSYTGIDYMQIKPVVYHPLDNKPQEPKEFWEKAIQFARTAELLYERPEGHPRGKFDVFTKYDQFGAIMRPDHDKSAYDKCRAIFFPIIEATGDVFHCSQTRGMPEFHIGNIKDQSFEEIWNSQKRKDLIKGIDVSKCQPVCRCHWMNKTLKTVMEGNNAPSFI